VFGHLLLEHVEVGVEHLQNLISELFNVFIRHPGVLLYQEVVSRFSDLVYRKVQLEVGTNLVD
jgi:hypothetical protein